MHPTERDPLPAPEIEITAVPVAAAPRSTLHASVPWLAALLIGASAHVVHFLDRPQPAARVDAITPEPMRDEADARADRRAIRAELRDLRRDVRRLHHRARPRREPPRACDQPTTERTILEHTTIDRQLLDEALLEPKLASSVRVVLSQVDGETVGFKLHGLRNGSLLRLFGFQSGDLITAINGEPVNSFDRVVGSLDPQPSRVEFTVDRQGTQVHKIVELL